MDQLKRMAVFAEVVAAGSLSGAARQLGMTPSAVSQHLRQLEDALGLALLALAATALPPPVRSAPACPKACANPWPRAS